VLPVLTCAFLHFESGTVVLAFLFACRWSGLGFARRIPSAGKFVGLA
jgi:hypothetical protein